MVPNPSLTGRIGSKLGIIVASTLFYFKSFGGKDHGNLSCHYVAWECMMYGAPEPDSPVRYGKTASM